MFFRINNYNMHNDGNITGLTVMTYNSNYKLKMFGRCQKVTMIVVFFNYLLHV